MNNKKICILCTANLKHMTLTSLYTEEFKKANQSYDIIYIDRYHEMEESDAAKLYRFELDIKKEWTYPVKLLHYWKFKKYAIDVIDENKYDFIIVWNEFTAFMFSDYLVKNYANRYCVNIRDQNYNRFFWVQAKYKQALSKCCFATISSEKFRHVFPKYDYLFIHSYNNNIIEKLKPVKRKQVIGKPIRLMFIGRMSYPETMYAVIDAIGNDTRFEFFIIGAECEKVLPHVNECGYKNVHIHGAFEPDETARFLEDADIIYSLNKENDIHSDTLLPIKLYYAIGKCIPILAFKSSFTYEYASRYNLGIGVTTKDFRELGDIMYKWYQELNQDDISEGCRRAMVEILESHNELKEMINEYILE